LKLIVYFFEESAWPPEMLTDGLRAE
jgi:hypothetical protein